MTNRRAHGTGRIYHRGDVWWIRFCIDGEGHDESSESTRQSEAVKLLNRRPGKIQTGRYQGPVARSPHLLRSRDHGEGPHLRRKTHDILSLLRGP
jgi:hypothetical protein